MLSGINLLFRLLPRGHGDHPERQYHCRAESSATQCQHNRLLDLRGHNKLFYYEEFCFMVFRRSSEFERRRPGRKYSDDLQYYLSNQQWRPDYGFCHGQRWAELYRILNFVLAFANLPPHISRKDYYGAWGYPSSLICFAVYLPPRSSLS